MADIHHISPDPLSQSEATSTSKIPALNEDGSNWVLYKAQFLAAVQAKGLRRYLEGRERVPQPTTAPGVDSDADERYETAVDKWLGNHLAIKMLLFQMVGAASPLLLFPGEVFNAFPYAPTLEGQYIIKNSVCTEKRFAKSRACIKPLSAFQSAIALE